MFVQLFIVSTLLVIVHTAPVQVQRGRRCKQVKDAITQKKIDFMHTGGEIDMERRTRLGSKKCASEQGGEMATKQRRRGQGGEIDYASVQGVAKMAARWITNELKLARGQRSRRCIEAMTQEEMAYMQPGGETNMERRARFGSKKCVSEQGGEMATKQRRRGLGN